MSAPQGRPASQADAVTILLAVVGALLLLPGLSSIVVGAFAVAGHARPAVQASGGIPALFLGTGLVIAFAGTALLWQARRRHRRREAANP